jgi:hypothetical protein
MTYRWTAEVRTELSHRQRQDNSTEVFLKFSQPRHTKRDERVMRKIIALFVVMGFVACGTMARSQSLDVQEQCASEARRAFQELEDENKAKYNQSTLIHEGVSDYQNHYNTKLDRCLMLINRRSVLPLSANLSDQQRQSALVDANERRYYANYVETQLAAETKPKIEMCELMPGMRQKTVCTTRAEFDAFAATYLEQ